MCSLIKDNKTTCSRVDIGSSGLLKLVTNRRYLYIYRRETKYILIIIHEYLVK